jgi:hypothetical protein
MRFRLKVRRVSELPVLDQSAFPPLPKLTPSQRFDFMSVLGEKEREDAAAVLITACSHHGRWEPIGQKEFQALNLRLDPFSSYHYHAADVWDRLLGMVKQGLVERVYYNGQFYFIPTPKLATITLSDPKKSRITAIPAPRTENQ